MKHLLKSYSQKTELRIESSVTLSQDKISLHFKITGTLKNYQFPQRDKPKRANELWKATCFELFLANSKTKTYYEINISTTLHWNIYRLETYRAEPKELIVSSKPFIMVKEDEQSYEIDFELECKELNLAEFDQYNLAVILLNNQKNREFWAVNPVGESPDFHDRGGFVFMSTCDLYKNIYLDMLNFNFSITVVSSAILTLIVIFAIYFMVIKKER